MEQAQENASVFMSYCVSDILGAERGDQITIRRSPVGILIKRLSTVFRDCGSSAFHSLVQIGVLTGLCLLVSCDSLNSEKRVAILLSFEGTVYAADDSTGIGTAIIDLRQWQTGIQFLSVQRALTDYRGRYRLEYLHHYYPSNGPRMSDLILTASDVGHYQGRAGMYPEPSLQFTEETQVYDFYLYPF
ncbi:hypothetical protein ACFL6T_02030 [Candidatus Zixiibacteriota bacterium]